MNYALPSMKKINIENQWKDCNEYLIDCAEYLNTVVNLIYFLLL